MSEPVTQAGPAPAALDALYGALFRPRSTFAAPLPSLRPAAALVLLVSIIWAFELTHGQARLLPLALLTALGCVLWGWLGMSAGLFLVTRGLYRRGEFHPICAAVGLALAPWLLLGPITVLAHLGKPGEAAAAVGSLLLFVWWLRLLLLGVRGAAGLTGGQALWTLIATELIAVAVPVVAMVLGTLAMGLAIAQAV